MFTSPSLMNLVRNSLQILSPRVHNGTRPFSRILPSLQSFGKPSAQHKHLFFTRGLSYFPQENESTSSSESFVQMRGLPFQATAADIVDFFKPLNIEPVEVIIHTNKVGRPNGVASVKFNSYDDALKSLQNDRNYMGHRYIELFLNVKSMNQRESHLPQHPLSSTSDVPNEQCRVILKGIPYKATTDEIMQFFAPLNIRPSEVHMRHGRFNFPTGMCDCIFESHEDALTALQNHKKYIGNRWIEVFLASGHEISQS